MAHASHDDRGRSSATFARGGRTDATAGGRGPAVGVATHNDILHRLLVESVKEYAIYMLDPDGIVSNWNAGAERAKGYTAEEIVGTHFSRFYTPEDRAAGCPAGRCRPALSTGQFSCEGWRVRRDRFTVLGQRHHRPDT